MEVARFEKGENWAKKCWDEVERDGRMPFIYLLLLRQGMAIGRI